MFARVTLQAGRASTRGCSRQPLWRVFWSTFLFWSDTLKALSEAKAIIIIIEASDVSDSPWVHTHTQARCVSKRTVCLIFGLHLKFGLSTRASTVAGLKRSSLLAGRPHEHSLSAVVPHLVMADVAEGYRVWSFRSFRLEESNKV